MPTQMNFDKGPSSYKTAKEGTTPVKGPSPNFQGSGGSSYRSSRTSPQMNVNVKASIKTKEDPGQGQKAGTGSQGGY